jgi:hypothetical protein
MQRYVRVFRQIFTDVRVEPLVWRRVVAGNKAVRRIKDRAVALDTDCRHINAVELLGVAEKQTATDAL